ncbi:exopolysaccharide biosynthesis protein, WecB/TagA/CpsF family [Nostoc sp. PCC 7524]|uniref:WecB/TagA/CpsF family glycosyltransferase n=1 Tax=Nostoc sp. (strain ATCC 29411 / PCC 7524) TaxID=28072 RepID=UPI00029F4702|nr:WecB/TagA/CpsF family glycosyltransferase [Nostoc sp. PCC 7524]AFY46891.1 exopolysaccharide biosynthesis protein, WecB/TagA/CpsF family [Nostoc sp. PCC 7524]
MSELGAIEMMESFIKQEPDKTHLIFIANSYTLNLATDNPEYRDVLNSANVVFADGTGVIWAARLRRRNLQSNLVGTDLIPKFLTQTSNCNYRYYLLGADTNTIKYAAEYASRQFPGWTLAGFHHGYLGETETIKVIEKINSLQPHLLLVGMGNPLQEYWLYKNQQRLKVPVCVGVGGLFDHWGGNLKRAPLWVRKLGFEWLQILLQQPGKKWRRYLIGNPKFIIRMVLIRD